MAVLTFENEQGYRSFGETGCREAGRALNERYTTATPFPHIAIDDFVSADALREIVADFPARENQAAFDRQQERRKYQFHPQECKSGAIRNLFAELNSQAFLSFLTELTGIAGLISDPYFFGAGLHETMQGGHLSIHADFNHHKRMHVERRLNLLIYLNENWEDGYGGALELWDRQMTACPVRVLPELGRAVIFNTDLDSYHGHPDPLTCPAELSRRSIATYYYTATGEALPSVDRDTNFQTRPNSDDRRDWKMMLEHFTRDWTPPALRRGRRRALLPKLFG